MPTAAERRQISGDGMTLPEVARLIEALRADNSSRFDKIDARFDSFDGTYVRRETYEANMQATRLYIDGQESRIAKLEGTLQWVLRTAGGGFIAAVIGLFFAASKWV